MKRKKTYTKSPKSPGLLFMLEKFGLLPDPSRLRLFLAIFGHNGPEKQCLLIVLSENERRKHRNEDLNPRSKRALIATAGLNLFSVKLKLLFFEQKYGDNGREKRTEGRGRTFIAN